MKRIVHLCCIAALVGCAAPEKSTTSISSISVTDSLIDAYLDDWHAAAASANFDDYFGRLDSMSVFIGTDASENWSKGEFAAFSKPYFDQGKAWGFTAIERSIYYSKDSSVIWFDELLDTWMGTCRGSGVLELSNKDWNLKHYVLSVAIPNESIEEVIKAKESLDSIFRATISD